MSPYLVIYIVYLICGISGAIMLRKKGPKELMAWSIVFIAYSSLPTLEMASSPDRHMSLIGQSLMVFFSIIGGALFSTAWGELRHSARETVNKSNQQGPSAGTR